MIDIEMDLARVVEALDAALSPHGITVAAGAPWTLREEHGCAVLQIPLSALDAVPDSSPLAPVDPIREPWGPAR